jgi:hypothetical protein
MRPVFIAMKTIKIKIFIVATQGEVTTFCFQIHFAWFFAWVIFNWEDRGDVSLRNVVCILKHYTVLYPRRQNSATHSALSVLYENIL